MTSKIKVVILYSWLGGKDKKEFIFKDGKFFEVKEREEIDKIDMEEILEEMEWVSEMLEKGVESFDKIVDKMVKEEESNE